MTFASWTSWDQAFLYFTVEPVRIHSQCGAQCRISESINWRSLAIQFISSRQICKFLWKTHGKLSKTSYQLHLEWSSECGGMEIFVVFCSVTGFWCDTFCTAYLPCVKCLIHVKKQNFSYLWQTRQVLSFWNCWYKRNSINIKDGEQLT